ncbi:bifunctional phosphatase PAP2/diacylglycerol kinase family protein [Rhodococcus sp. NPDC058521]|uniref:bifunctional phosphatase PAP2/diacylglycerol kinase family protein n=1 Tax=Rhodococcus sp. NPDC058521 TaxID=3346536 RepID=UPI003669D3E4
MQRPIRRLRHFDHHLMERGAALRPSAADRLFRVLSKTADHGLLWWAIAAALSAFGERPRRGAARGLLALVCASAVANGVLKPTFPRRRPPPRKWSTPHRGVPIPTSSSFPSGHSASAAAFVAGVATEAPAAGVVLAPVAAAVSYSRVHNGVHWPSDVCVGAAVGCAVAVATRRWWAVRPDEHTTEGEFVTVPSLDRGAGLLVFANRTAGGEFDDPVAEIVDALPAARLCELDPDASFTSQMEKAVDEYRPRAVGVCGGDGTVAVAADVAVRHDLPLAAFPGGTLNHFVRDLGSVDTGDIANAVTKGSAARIDCAEVDLGNGPTRFVNTATLGGYPDAVRLRESWESRFGKWPSAAAAMIRVLADASPIDASIDGRRVSLWMLFVGNGRYSPADQVPMSRPQMTGGLLDVRYVQASGRGSRLRLLLSAATGNLAGSSVYKRIRVSSLTVRVDGEPVALACDGEVVGDSTSFEFVSEPAAITVYR